MAEESLETQIAKAALKFYEQNRRATENQAREHARDEYDDHEHVTMFLKSWKRIKQMKESIAQAESQATVDRNWPEEKGY